jgi:hypothetical protein
MGMSYIIDTHIFINGAIALLLSPLKTKAVQGKPVITNTMPLSTS